MAIGSMYLNHNFEQQEMNHRQDSGTPVATHIILADPQNGNWNPSFKKLKPIAFGSSATRSPSSNLSKDMDILHSKTFYKTSSSAAKKLKELLDACDQISRAIYDACDQISRAVCGATTNSSTQMSIIALHGLSPLQYLTSPILLARWEVDLGIICRRYKSGKLSEEDFEQIIESILPGVERLEESRTKLQEEFQHDLKREGFDYVIPKEFWAAIEERCLVIEEAFKSF
jgi:hypothetical protein